MKRLLRLLYKQRLGVLFLTAFIIRLIGLNQSLWLDEATTAVTVQTYSFWEIVTQFSPSDFHPPLYYLFMDLWTAAFGYSEIALRMPSVLFSLGAGWFIYVTSRKGSLDTARDDNVAFWSAAFFLFNPLIIYYSQEARMYMMVTFLVAANFYYLIKVARRKNRDLWLMNGTLVLMFWTFYASVFYIAAVCLYLLFRKQYIVFFSAVMSFLFSLAVISPLLYTQYVSSRIALQTVANWSLVLGKVTMKNLFLIPIKFTSGRISFHPKMLYYALAAGWAAIVFGAIGLGVMKQLKRLKEKKETFMLIVFFTLPLVLGALFSLSSPLLQYFRFVYLIVFLSMLISLALQGASRIRLEEKTQAGNGDNSFKGRWQDHRRIVRFEFFFNPHFSTFLLLLGFLTWSLLYLLFPQYHREDWKRLARSLDQEKASIYMIPSSSDPLSYYAPHSEVNSLSELDSGSSPGMTSKPGTLIVIPYTADIHGVDYRSALQSSSYTLKRTVSVRELQYEVWAIQ